MIPNLNLLNNFVKNAQFIVLWTTNFNIYRLLDVRAHMDQYLGTGRIACGVVTVVGENGILCTVNLPGLDQFQIPLIGSFHFHRLQHMPFVEWLSITQFGEEAEGLSALSDFISNHHLVPDLGSETEQKMIEEVDPKAYPSHADEIPTLAKRSVSRTFSDESLSKETVTYF